MKYQQPVLVLINYEFGSPSNLQAPISSVTNGVMVLACFWGYSLQGLILSDGQFSGVANSAAVLTGLIAGVLLNTVVAQFILLFKSDSPYSPKIPFARPDTSCAGCAHGPDLCLKPQSPPQRIVRESGSPYRDHFSPRSLVIVVISTLLFSGMSFLFHNPVSWLIACLFLWFLFALSVIDYFTFILPNALTQPLLWFGLLISTLGYGVPVESAIFGAASGYLSLWSLYWCFMILIKKEGMGFGDFKLLAAIGAWSGWEALPAVCTLAALIGIFYAVIWGRFFRHDGLIPFGPALSLSGLLVYISQRSEVVWLM